MCVLCVAEGSKMATKPKVTTRKARGWWACWSSGSFSGNDQMVIPVGTVAVYGRRCLEVVRSVTLWNLW